MIVLAGADLVLPDRICRPARYDRRRPHRGDRPDAPSAGPTRSFAFHGHYIVPGFIDVHVHGVDGVDSLDGAGAIAAIAERLPRYGVTAFCPTTVACAPARSAACSTQVRRAREVPGRRAARVLPAHLESNFINPEYAGAQPLACLRIPRSRGAGGQVAPERDG